MYIYICINVLHVLSLDNLSLNTDVNSEDDKGQTPLHMTIKRHSMSNSREECGKTFSILMYLLESGADMEHRERLKQHTPLLYAIARKDIEVALKLMQRGRHVDVYS